MAIHFHWSFVAEPLSNGTNLPYEFHMMQQRIRKYFGPVGDHTLVMEQVLPEDWDYTQPVPDTCPQPEPCPLNHYPPQES